jgi:molecular chaperone Hsp33
MNGDRLVRGFACGHTVRCAAAVTTELVDEACRRHRTSPTVAAALGRSLTAGLLLGTMLKEVERLTLIFHCQGPIERITVEADALGNVRGYVRNPAAERPLTDRSKFDVKGIVGGGMLYVMREGEYYRTGLYRDPYVGSVPIVSGEIAEDIAYYLTQSEQIPSAVSLGVFVVPDGERAFRVAAAGGFIVQTFPGTSPNVITNLERSIAETPSITQLIRQGKSPEEILQTALGKYDFEVLESRPVQFRCTCSQERAERILAALDPDYLQEMLEEDGGAEMVCQFCSAAYRFAAEDLARLRAEAREEENPQ